MDCHYHYQEITDINSNSQHNIRNFSNEIIDSKTREIAIQTFDSENQCSSVENPNFISNNQIIPKEIIKSLIKEASVSSIFSLAFISKQFKSASEEYLTEIAKHLKLFQTEPLKQLSLNEFYKLFKFYSVCIKLRDFKTEENNTLDDLINFYTNIRNRIAYGLKDHEHLKFLTTEINNISNLNQPENYFELKKIIDTSDSLLFWKGLKTVLYQSFTIKFFTDLNELYDTQKAYYNWCNLEIQRLDKVQYLDFSDYKLTSIPEEIGLFENLKLIELERNHLSYLPLTLYELKNLETIQIYSNHLEFISKKIDQNINLKNLYLRDNQITMIPSSIKNLTQLKCLDISKNPYKVLPEDLKECKSLEALHLFESQLEVFPRWTSELTNLRRLSFEKHLLKELPEELLNRDNLTIIT